MEIDENFRNQFRSWEIMREYFGIYPPNSRWIEFDLPPELEEILAGIQSAANEAEKKRIGFT